MASRPYPDRRERIHCPQGQGLRCARETCPTQLQGQFFSFFVGMRAVSFDSTNGDHLDSIQRAWFPAVQRLFTFGDRVPLRADLGQSQSGNSSLSPRASRAQSTSAELAVWEILPSTSVRAPRNYAWRSPQGREDNLRKVAGQIGGLRGSQSRRRQSSL